MFTLTLFYTKLPYYYHRHNGTIKLMHKLSFGSSKQNTSRQASHCKLASPQMQMQISVGRWWFLVCRKKARIKVCDCKVQENCPLLSRDKLETAPCSLHTEQHPMGALGFPITFPPVLVVFQLFLTTFYRCKIYKTHKIIKSFFC